MDQVYSVHECSVGLALDSQHLGLFGPFFKLFLVGKITAMIFVSIAVILQCFALCELFTSSDISLNVVADWWKHAV